MDWFHFNYSVLELVIQNIVHTDKSNPCRFERPLYIAILTDLEDVDEIKKVFQREIKIQGDEQEAMFLQGTCC